MTCSAYTIVEYTDYQCSFCQQFYSLTFQNLKTLYIDTGKVRFYSMDLPLVEMHPVALLGARAGHCAAEQGKFWQMHDKMLAGGQNFEAQKLVDSAGDLSVDVAAFRECLNSEKYKDVILASAQDAINKGARGTPSFVVGKSTAYGVEGELFVGALPLGVFQQKLKNLGLRVE